MNLEILEKHLEVTRETKINEVKIIGHPIFVKDIVVWHIFMGHSVEEIAKRHNLTLSDVYAALTYYYDYKQEIDERINTEALREALREQQEPRENTVSNVETPRTSMLRKSAIVIGWCLLIFVVIPLVLVVLFNIESDVSFALQGLGVDTEIADTSGEIAVSMAIVFVWPIVWFIWQKLRGKDSEVKNFFTASNLLYISLFLLLGPIFNLTLQIFGVSENAVFIILIVVLFLLVMYNVFLKERFGTARIRRDRQS